MIEADWLACPYPRKLLSHLGETSGERKRILLGCACARRVWHAFSDPRSRTGVEIAEAFADCLASSDEMAAAAKRAEEAARELVRLADSPRAGRRLYCDYPAEVAVHAAYAASYVARGCIQDRHEELGTGLTAATNVVRYLCADRIDPQGTNQNAANFSPPTEEKQAESQAQARLLRDIIGNPYRPLTLAIAYRTPTVVSHARAAYDERHLPSGELHLQRLAILADALEEVGAPDELVAHLRGPGPHVRGCFAVDLCLGLS